MACSMYRSCALVAKSIPLYIQLCNRILPGVSNLAEESCVGARTIDRSPAKRSTLSSHFIAGWISGYGHGFMKSLLHGDNGLWPGFAALDVPSVSQGIWLTSHQTYKPNVYKRKHCHGFLKRYSDHFVGRFIIRECNVGAELFLWCRLASSGGRRTLKRRKIKKRSRLSL